VASDYKMSLALFLVLKRTRLECLTSGVKQAMGVKRE